MGKTEPVFTKKICKREGGAAKNSTAFAVLKVKETKERPGFKSCFKSSGKGTAGGDFLWKQKDYDICTG